MLHFQGDQNNQKVNILSHFIAMFAVGKINTAQKGDR